MGRTRFAGPGRINLRSGPMRRAWPRLKECDFVSEQAFERGESFDGRR